MSKLKIKKKKKKITGLDRKTIFLFGTVLVVIILLMNII